MTTTKTLTTMMTLTTPNIALKPESTKVDKRRYQR